MCYFVEINLSRNALSERFGIPMPEDPRYMPSVFLSAFARPWLPVVSSGNPVQIGLSRWGLIPSWIKDEKGAEDISYQTANARSETIWEKPAFRKAAKDQRCAVLVNGWFEWQQSGKSKIPYYIGLRNKHPFALAGLWDKWTNPDTGEILDTCSVLTTDANPLMATIHNTKKRMPVLLDDHDIPLWLDTNAGMEDLKTILHPCSEEKISAFPLKYRPSGKDHGSVNPDILLPAQPQNPTPNLFS